MTNKEIIERLANHFLASEPEEVARALASMILDFHNLHTLKDLRKDQKENLFERMRLNEEQFIDFIINESETPFKVIRIS